MSEPSEFGFGIKAVTLADGWVIELSFDGLTVVTGGNNSGKSLFLQELVSSVATPPQGVGRWIAGVEATWQGDADAFVDWLIGRGLLQSSNNGVDAFSVVDPTLGRPATRAHLTQAWQNCDIAPIGSALISGLSTGSRLQEGASAPQWDRGTQQPSHPVQHLWLDKTVHEQFSIWVERAFGQRIVINRHNLQINLQLSVEREPDEVSPPAPASYLEWFAAQPSLAEQGDGVRSFVHVLLQALVRPAAVVVIDEPEAFLHPPQARLLGKILAEETRAACQVIVATHSADFLHGVLESKPDNTRLIRLSRTAEHQDVHVLGPGDVREILTDPFTRYANIVSGFFHDGVVVCEAEGDCRFYAATLEAMVSAVPATPDPNLAFIHVGGKARLAVAVRKLRSLGIPAVVIADIDMLDTKPRVRQLVQALDGEWDRVAPHLDLLHRAAGAVVRSTQNVAHVRKRMNEILGSSNGQDTLSVTQTNAIAELGKRSTYWKDLKRSGLRGLDGQEYNALEQLLSYLGDLGALLVPVGELERWHPGIGGRDKNAWISDVFEQEKHLTPPDELAHLTKRYLEHLTRRPPTSRTRG
ncbi:AAA family ATPase [Embleya sp. NPDC001921]